MTVQQQGSSLPPDGWHVLRLLSNGCQQDGVRRLCLKSLKLHGVVRVNLLNQDKGMLMNNTSLNKALSPMGS